MDNVPPCLKALGMNRCARALYDWQVHGNGPLHGAWVGWRIAGDELITPMGDRISRAMVLRLGQELWFRGLGRKRRRPAALPCARAKPSALPTPSEADGGPVGRAVAPLAGRLRGDVHDARGGAGFSGE